MQRELDEADRLFREADARMRAACAVTQVGGRLQRPRTPPACWGRAGAGRVARAPRAPWGLLLAALISIPTPPPRAKQEQLDRAEAAGEQALEELLGGESPLLAVAWLSCCVVLGRRYPMPSRAARLPLWGPPAVQPTIQPTPPPAAARAAGSEEGGQYLQARQFRVTAATRTEWAREAGAQQGWTLKGGQGGGLGPVQRTAADLPGRLL